MPHRSSKKPISRHTARPPARPMQIRIIGGQWKRSLLPVSDVEGLRPTPDRVRETVFNWLNHLLNGAWSHIYCLDLFAGTGALGFEAASRGAAHVAMVEANAKAVMQLNAAKEKLQANQVHIVQGNALSAGTAMQDTRFHVIFLDPPYHQGWLPKILPYCKNILTPGGLIYVESETALTGEPAPDWLIDWEIVRADKAGMVFFHLLRCKKQ